MGEEAVLDPELIVCEGVSWVEASDARSAGVDACSLSLSELSVENCEDLLLYSELTSQTDPLIILSVAVVLYAVSATDSQSFVSESYLGKRRGRK